MSFVILIGGSLAEYWSSTEYSHVIQFSLQNMLDDNVTALQIDNASLFIYFQAGNFYSILVHVISFGIRKLKFMRQ